MISSIYCIWTNYISVQDRCNKLYVINSNYYYYAACTRGHTLSTTSRYASVACKTEKKKKSFPKSVPAGTEKASNKCAHGYNEAGECRFFCVRGYNERRLAKVLVPAGTIARTAFVAAGTTWKSGRFSKIFDFATFSITRISMESERVRFAELRLQLCFTANACSPSGSATRRTNRCHRLFGSVDSFIMKELAFLIFQQSANWILVRKYQWSRFRRFLKTNL